MAMPVASFGLRRQKEIELRERLRKITDAIDHYHDLAVAGAAQGPGIGRAGQVSEGARRTRQRRREVDGRRSSFLRERDLIDPMTGQREWDMLSTSDEPDTHARAMATTSSKSTPSRTRSRSTARPTTTNGEQKMKRNSETRRGLHPHRAHRRRDDHRHPRRRSPS